jgi:hypothetical protein
MLKTPDMRDIFPGIRVFFFGSSDVVLFRPHDSAKAFQVPMNAVTPYRCFLRKPSIRSHACFDALILAPSRPFC